MDLWTVLVDSAMSTLLLVNLGLCIALFFKKVRVIVRPYVVIVSVILMTLELHAGCRLFAGMFAFVGVLNLIGVIYEHHSKEDESDEVSKVTESHEGPRSDPIVLKITAVAVDDRPKMPTRRILCPHCGAPNRVFDRNMTDCAYCSSTLA